MSVTPSRENEHMFDSSLQVPTRAMPRTSGIWDVADEDLIDRLLLGRASPDGSEELTAIRCELDRRGLRSEPMVTTSPLRAF